MIQLDTRCSVSSHHDIPLSVIKKILIVHQEMKLNAGL